MAPASHRAPAATTTAAVQAKADRVRRRGGTGDSAMLVASGVRSSGRASAGRLTPERRSSRPRYASATSVEAPCFDRGCQQPAGGDDLAILESGRAAMQQLVGLSLALGQRTACAFDIGAGTGMATVEKQSRGSRRAPPARSARRSSDRVPRGGVARHAHRRRQRHVGQLRRFRRCVRDRTSDQEHFGAPARGTGRIIARFPNARRSAAQPAWVW
jgi:hypothetical protein